MGLTRDDVAKMDEQEYRWIVISALRGVGIMVEQREKALLALAKAGAHEDNENAIIKHAAACNIGRKDAEKKLSTALLIIGVLGGTLCSLAIWALSQVLAGG